MEIPKSDFSEWYNSIIKDAELCDIRYDLKGFVVFRPWAVMTMNRMFTIYEKELESKGHVPALFPALIPESYLMKESEHVEGFVPEVFWITAAGNNPLEERYAMRPTSETAMYSMYSLWIHGLKDLPLKIYQRCQVWRHETKATKPFIRSREFYWIEAHDAFATEKEAEAQVKEDMGITEKILHQQFCVPFFFFKRPQWDKFAGAVDTYGADALMPDRKALQLPSTHMLGQNFAKPFNIKYMDDNEKEQYVWQTCYGPAISRIYAAVIAVHGDDKGLVLPFDIAPVQIVIVPIVKKETKEKVMKKCKELEKKLSGKYVVKLDEGEDTPGAKYNYWEMKGVPIRLEIGLRDIEKNSVMLFRRDTKKKEPVAVEKLEGTIEKLREEIRKNLKEKADKWFMEQNDKADSMEEFEKKVETRGFIRIPFCTDQMEGKPCAEIIRDKVHANIRGSLYGEKEKPRGKKCIACGKPAKIYLYASRQY